MDSLCKPQRVVSWICRLTAAGILLQTLYFKFSGAPESVYIFTKVGLEPWGRYGSGVVELIAASLLLTPRLCWAGALLAIAIMLGAIGSHLTVLGIEVREDGGLLFSLAMMVLLASSMTAVLHRREIPFISGLFKIQRA